MSSQPEGVMGSIMGAVQNAKDAIVGKPGETKEAEKVGENKGNLSSQAQEMKQKAGETIQEYGKKLTESKETAGHPVEKDSDKGGGIMGSMGNMAGSIKEKFTGPT